MQASWTRIVGWVVLLAVMAVTWRQVAPAAWGGRTTFLVVQGTSMLPRFHAGDLVAVVADSSYSVGTIAAYHDVPYHAIFFHRIIAEHDGHYTFQGINNPAPDPFHPTTSEIVGRFWFVLPKVGLWLAFWRQPAHAAMLVTATAFVTVLANPRRKKKMGTSGTSRGSQPHGEWSWWGVGVAAAAVCTLAAVALSAWSALSPLTVSRADALLYSQHGRFSYTAATGKTVVYPSGSVATGMPLYVPLVSKAHVAFTYHLDVPGGQVAGGRASLDAELVSTSGWHRTWTVVPSTAFKGATVTLRGSVNVLQLFTMIAGVEKLTGDVMDAYRFVLLPHVRAMGLQHGHLVSARFHPSLGFNVETQWLSLQTPNMPLGQYLAPSMKGVVPVLATVPNDLTLLGTRVPVATARQVSPVVAAVLALGTGFLVWGERRRERRLGVAARIARQYGGLLVDVDALPFSPMERSIRVGSMAGLVRLAEQCERSILHARHGVDHLYLLENVGESYYFSVRDTVDEATEAAGQPLVGTQSVAPQ